MTQKDILHFWRNIEIFNFPDLDKDSVIEIKNQLPWNTPKTIEKGKKRIYTLFFGEISKENIVNHIENLFPSKEKVLWEEKVSGFTCLSSIILDEKGQPDANSYTLASYVLGLNVLHNKRDISSVFQLLQNVQDEYSERFNILKNQDNENSKGEVVTWDFINKEIDYLKQLTPWNTKEIKVYYLEKDVSINTELDAPFLNSFFLEDLNNLIDKKTELSLTLQDYLTLTPYQQKLDLIKNKEELFKTIHPEYLTEGKWASSPQYGLCTAQLGAVNSIFKDLNNSSGLQGVNGPPGTGKTTLLLDVIAQIIVDRAKYITNIGTDNLFGKGVKLDFKDRYQYVYPLNASLQKNFGIVVASNNNAAVENISKELPQLKKIDKKAFSNADYFGEFAKEELTGSENWGILAAALGNSENKSKFHNLFWKSFIKDENGNSIVDKEVNNFQNYLVKIQSEQEKNPSKKREILSNFENAKNNFEKKLKEFNTFKTIAVDFHNRFDEFRKNIALKKELDISKIEKETAKNQFINDLKALEIRKNEKDKEQENVKISLNFHNNKKPIFFFFQKLFNTENYKKWNNEISEILSEFDSISSEIKQLNSQIEKKSSELNIVENQLKSFQNQLNQIERFEKEYENLKSQLTQDYKIEEKNLFDEKFYGKDLKEIHLLSPYHSEFIAKLRSEIFLNALEVHKYTILNNAKQFKNNLNSFFEMITGRAKIDEELIQSLWDTFFFCVPVVSTSLASASKLFPNMAKNQIGWLLIDEAGQATPQSVAGLIQRSKRCVIVGDPIQVEPVVTIPKTLVDGLIKHQNIDSVWSPYNGSAQQLADRISKYGTQMGDVWTGFPLRTHRRCFNPMFDIANEIAYENQMVKGTKDKNEQEYIGESYWFDVAGNGSGDSQVINEEIELLKEKISELRKTYLEDIYVISPFKAVADKCRGALNNFENVQCGTIHTFQGKEADVIFLVLGSHPDKVGSRQWASTKPNMLNVALTRAKKRCYVIGNKELWGQQPYFSVMGKVLKMK